MADLTPEEQRFFETGELTGSLATQQQVVDPVALAGIAGGLEPPVPPSAAPAPPSAIDPPTLPPQQNDALEILRRSLAEAQSRVGALEAHLQQFQAQPPAQPPVQAPDPETDPLGNMMHQLAEVNKTVLALQNQLQQQQSQSATVDNFRAFQQQVNALKNEFAKSTPDFDTAYTHLRDMRVADLRALGVNEAQIKQALFHEDIALAENAIRNGKNPAEVLYETAKRHGYITKQAAAPAAPDAKLTAIQQAQAAARNLPKSINPDEFTIEGLKDLSDADLNKAVMDEKLWAKISGKDVYPI